MNGQCNRHGPIRRRAGFTLFELLVSMAAASVLMAGLSSAIYIAAQGVEVSESPQAKLLEGQALLADICADLQFAIAITEQKKDIITLTIPDRDDPDTTPEIVRYDWHGTNKLLTRQVNGGAVVVVAESVHHIHFQYVIQNSSVAVVAIELQLIDHPDAFLITSIPILNRQ